MSKKERNTKLYRASLGLNKIETQWLYSLSNEFPNLEPHELAAMAVSYAASHEKKKQAHMQKVPIIPS